MKFYNTILTIALLFASSVIFSKNLNQIEMQEKQIQSKTVVFIHGLFMNNKTWDEWKTLFESQGYTCYAPAHPKHDGNPAELRANPP